jgi:mono/diheme cytochrome c family protein
MRRSCDSTWLFVFLGLLLGAGCGASRASSRSEGEAAPQDQWSQGVWLYGQNCASCHGENGEGEPEETPPLAGEGSLPTQPAEGQERTTPLNTAADLFQFTRSAMPPLSPGSLTEEQYWALSAYVLFLRDGKRRETPLGPAEAKTIKLHP